MKTKRKIYHEVETDIICRWKFENSQLKN